MSQDGSVRIWNVATGQATEVYAGGKKNPLYAVAFALDGKSLAAVGDDGRLRMWRTKDWNLEVETRISKLPLYAVAFPPGQPLVVTAGEDGKVYLIDRPPSSAN